MRTANALAACAFLLATSACNKSSTAPVETPESSSASTPAGTTRPKEDAQVSMSGSMTLRAFRPDMAGGESRGASFEISSPQCSLMEDGRWALTPATAIIYDLDGQPTKFEAGSAEFDEKADTASLRDGVTVDLGPQHVELQDMEWTNKDGTARSGSPLTVTDGETKLSAQGMEYHADSKTLLLDGVTGTVSLEQRETSP